MCHYIIHLYVLQFMLTFGLARENCSYICTISICTPLKLTLVSHLISHRLLCSDQFPGSNPASASAQVVVLFHRPISSQCGLHGVLPAYKTQDKVNSSVLCPFQQLESYQGRPSGLKQCCHQLAETQYTMHSHTKCSG